MADLYGPFLWRHYVNILFLRDGLPFLKSRRSIFYHLKEKYPDEPAMKVLERIGKANNLFSLDRRIGETVVRWANNAKNTV